MKLIRYQIPVLIALLFGWLTLLGLLVVPAISNLILGWAGFLAAVALVLGVLNLFVVHLLRIRQNRYSLVLLLSMLAVFGLAVTDALGITDHSVTGVFNLVQAPLEAALASLLAFFLLFMGVRLLRRQRNVWSGLFMATAIVLLLSQSPLPGQLNALLTPVRNLINAIFVTAGMRGILIGVALATITLSLRLLAGLERPYNK